MMERNDRAMRSYSLVIQLHHEGPPEIASHLSNSQHWPSEHRAQHRPLSDIQRLAVPVSLSRFTAVSGLTGCPLPDALLHPVRCRAAFLDGMRRTVVPALDAWPLGG